VETVRRSASRTAAPIAPAERFEVPGDFERHGTSVGAHPRHEFAARVGSRADVLATADPQASERAGSSRRARRVRLRHPLAGLVVVPGASWAIEECFQSAKNETA
jgi:hypothetical protein